MELVGPDPEPDDLYERILAAEEGSKQELVLLKLKVRAAQMLGKLACR